MTQVVDVVAAVIYSKADGRYLLAQRPAGKVYAGYWEFPGGKVEPGETPLAAIKREIREELDIEILAADPWITRYHIYEHASVRLRFFRVHHWRGEPRGVDGQNFTFQTPGAENVRPMLPANSPILKAVGLPTIYGITSATATGFEAFYLLLEEALRNGLRLVQLREKTLPPEMRRRVGCEVLARCRDFEARMLINDDIRLAADLGAHGVHFSAHSLRELANHPGFELVGASTHNREEIEMAQRLGIDFAVLGPVQPTLTHPDSPALGWSGFAAVVADAQLPVYALGGLSSDSLSIATSHGAHGIGMLRGAWFEKADSSGEALSR